VGLDLHHGRWGAGDSLRRMCTGGDVIAKCTTDHSGETSSMGIRDVRLGREAGTGVGAGTGAGGADAVPRTPLRSSACVTCSDSMAPSISLSDSTPSISLGFTTGNKRVSILRSTRQYINFLTEICSAVCAHRLLLWGHARAKSCPVHLPANSRGR
jgi:hypothetical protein